LAQQMNEKGFNASALRGGYDAWVEKGFPVEPK